MLPLPTCYDASSHLASPPLGAPVSTAPAAASATPLGSVLCFWLGCACTVVDREAIATTSLCLAGGFGASLLPAARGDEGPPENGGGRWCAGSGRAPGLSPPAAATAAAAAAAAAECGAGGSGDAAASSKIISPSGRVLNCGLAIGAAGVSW